MAKDLNAVQLSGRLGSDPTAKILPSGVEVAEFRLANNKLGSDEPNWFNINVYGAAARFANQYLKKGDRVLVAGRIEIRQYQDQQGVQKIAVSIESNDVISFNDSGNRAEHDAPAPQARQSRQPQQPSQSQELFDQRAAEAQQMMAQQQGGKLTQLVNKKAAQNMNGVDDLPY